MNNIQRLKQDYPWIQTPLVVGAPMRLIALADMAVEISKAGTSTLLHLTTTQITCPPPLHLHPLTPTGGIGFIGAGTDVSDLHTHLQNAATLLSPHPLPTHNTTLPLGIGFINWGADLAAAIPLIHSFKPAAVWFFAPSSLPSLADWCAQTRAASPDTKIWVQVGSVREARSVVDAVSPDVLVVQGTDAGGHGLECGAGLVALLPEVVDVLGRSNERPVLMAAGGISNATGALASLVLGAEGVCMGTRFLASPEANISEGYRREVLRAGDGGQTTRRTKVYDNLRGTVGWGKTHNARGILNRSYWDHVGGMSEEENKRLYKEEMGKGDEGWGEDRRMTAYAGSGVGLVKEVKGAGDIVREIREGVRDLAGGVKALL